MTQLLQHSRHFGGKKLKPRFDSHFTPLTIWIYFRFSLHKCRVIFYFLFLGGSEHIQVFFLLYMILAIT